VKGKHRKRETLRKILQTLWKDDKIKGLERRLARVRKELLLHLTVDTRWVPLPPRIGYADKNLLCRDKVCQVKLEQSKSLKDLDSTTKRIVDANHRQQILQRETAGHADARREILREITSQGNHIPPGLRVDGPPARKASCRRRYGGDGYKTRSRAKMEWNKLMQSRERKNRCFNCGSGGHWEGRCREECGKCTASTLTRHGFYTNIIVIIRSLPGTYCVGMPTPRSLSRM
jgi:hypothetical protein